MYWTSFQAASGWADLLLAERLAVPPSADVLWRGASLALLERRVERRGVDGRLVVEGGRLAVAGEHLATVAKEEGAHAGRVWWQRDALDVALCQRLCGALQVGPAPVGGIAQAGLLQHRLVIDEAERVPVFRDAIDGAVGAVERRHERAVVRIPANLVAPHVRTEVEQLARG